MRHGVKGRKFGRYSKHRKSMFANLVKEMVNHGQIIITLPKAKDLRPIIEKVVTAAKTDNLAARRLLIARFGMNQAQVNTLFTDIAVRFKERAGGYTRILKYGCRRGDAAPMAAIQFVDCPERRAQGLI